MNDSLQHLLHAVEPEFPALDIIINGAGVSGSDSAGELARSSKPEGVSRRRPAPRGTAAYPRKRANRACQVCRARRTKCDNKKPACSFCEKVGAKCITTPTDLSSFDPASLAILDRLEQLEQLIRGKQIAATPPSNPPQPEEQFTLGYASPAPDLQFGPDFSTVTIETVLAWHVFRGKFDSRLDLKCLLRSQELPSSPLTSPVGDNIPLINSLEMGSCNRLLDSFLDRVHIANPILDVSAVRGMVHNACMNGIGWDPQSCLVLLICALGSIAESFNDRHGSTSIHSRTSPSFTLARSFFEAAQKRIGLLLRGGGTIEAQCFFYSGVYLMTLQQPMDAWRHFVQAAAISQGFDFPRKSLESAEALPNNDMRRERAAQESMYWTCFKSELEVRMELSLPGFGLHDLSYPSSFPSPPSDFLGEDSARPWYYYLAEIALRRLANRILYHLFRNEDKGRFPRICDMVESTAAFEGQAADWVASLPPMFALASEEDDDDILKFVLRGHLLDCYEWMYFPFMAETINYGRRGTLIDEYTRKGLQMSVDRIRKNAPGFQHRHHGAWLMMRTCTRSALILLAACHSEAVQDLIPEGWKDAVLSAIDLLRFWKDEVGDARDRLAVLTELMNDLGYRV